MHWSTFELRKLPHNKNSTWWPDLPFCIMTSWSSSSKWSFPSLPVATFNADQPGSHQGVQLSWEASISCRYIIATTLATYFLSFYTCTADTPLQLPWPPILFLSTSAWLLHHCNYHSLLFSPVQIPLSTSALQIHHCNCSLSALCT